MKIYLIIIFIFPFILFSQNIEDSSAIKDSLKKEVENLPFTQLEATQAIKEALLKGVDMSISKLSVVDGYYQNEEVRILFPKNAEEQREKFVKMGLEEDINRIVLGMNRAAENATIFSKPLFEKAIKEINISVAFEIISGDSSIATFYLQEKIKDSLFILFKPIIKKSLDEFDVTLYWSGLMEIYNQFPFTKDVHPDLSDYVTKEALKGIFYMIAKEEAYIRRNTSERTSELLKKVFDE